MSRQHQNQILRSLHHKIMTEDLIRPIGLFQSFQLLVWCRDIIRLNGKDVQTLTGEIGQTNRLIV